MAGWSQPSVFEKPAIMSEPPARKRPQASAHSTRNKGGIKGHPIYFGISEILLANRPKSAIYPLPSRPTEGRLAIVTDAWRDAVGAAAQLTNIADAYGQVVSF